MSDTLIAPVTPGTAGVPSAPTAPTVPATPMAPVVPTTDAASALKSATSWADLNLPGMAVSSGDDPAPGTDPSPATPEHPEHPENAPSPDEGPEFVQNAQGQWHRPDGTFANADEIAQIEAQLAATPADPPASAEAESKGETVQIRRRDGTTRDVVIDDPELAQEIRQNVNDGMRRKEFLEKSAALDARLAQFNRLDALLEQNPEAVVHQSLTPDQRVRLGVMLLAEHFDDLIPAINQYNTDPGARFAATAEAQQRIRTQETEFQAFTQAQGHAAAVKTAVAGLIPETVEQDIAERFWADASHDCQRAMARGEPVTPATVAAILAPRLSLYGFANAGTPPAAAPPRITAVTAAPAASSPSSPVAVPANDPAKALEQARATQKRIRLTQGHRSNAAAVPPVGAGAAPVRMPPVPKGATVEEASSALKRMRSWSA